MIKALDEHMNVRLKKKNTILFYFSLKFCPSSAQLEF